MVFDFQIVDCLFFPSTMIFQKKKLLIFWKTKM